MAKRRRWLGRITRWLLAAGILVYVALVALLVLFRIVNP